MWWREALARWLAWNECGGVGQRDTRQIGGTLGAFGVFNKDQACVVNVFGYEEALAEEVLQRGVLAE